MEELIDRAKKKDENAFTEAVLLIQQELYLIAKAKLKNEADIDDAMQETMIASYQNIHKLKQVQYFKTWIIKILINQCNKIYRKNNKKQVSLEEMEESLLSDEFLEEDISFLMLIQHLNNEEQLILTLYYCSCYTTKEISQLLKINENTIRTKMLRAKGKLRKEYNLEGE